MLLFSVKWIVAIVSVTGMPFAFVEVRETVALPHAECVQRIKDHELRAADLVRGKLDLDWSTEIVAKGTCEPAGDPA